MNRVVNERKEVILCIRIRSGLFENGVLIEVCEVIQDFSGVVRNIVVIEFNGISRLSCFGMKNF